MNFFDTSAIYNRYKSEFDEAVCRVMSSGQYIAGEDVTLVEHKLSSTINQKYCVTCGNGTDALTLSLLALGVEAGDWVFTSSYSFIASAGAIALVSAHPVFIDIDARTFNICADHLESVILDMESEGLNIPKVLISVNLFGLAADYKKINAICEKHGISVIEDSAQAYGGKIGSKWNGSFGLVSTTSFFPTKPLGCFGDGGAIFTSDSKVHKKLLPLKSHGARPENKYISDSVGTNSRLDSIQAAILSVRIKYLRLERKERDEIASKYDEGLNGDILCPMIPESYTSAWAQYSILLPKEINRNKFVERVRRAEIPLMIYYACALPDQPVFKDKLVYKTETPRANNTANNILSLPMHSALLDGHVDAIVDAVNSNL